MGLIFMQTVQFTLKSIKNVPVMLWLENCLWTQYPRKSPLEFPELGNGAGLKIKEVIAHE